MKHSPAGFPFLPLILFALLPDGARAASTDLQAVVRRVQSFYRSSPGIVAEFTQVLESRTLPRPQEERGTVSLKAPGRMRWEYSHPRGKLAITDGNRAYLYLPEDRAVLVGSMQDLDSGAVTTRLLLGERPLESEFNVEGEPARDGSGVWILNLEPKKGGLPYDSLQLEVSPESGAIQRIRMIDPLGNRMEYRFEGIRVEKGLPEKLFTYRIPRGVEIQTFGSERNAADPAP